MSLSFRDEKYKTTAILLHILHNGLCLWARCDLLFKKESGNLIRTYCGETDLTLI